LCCSYNLSVVGQPFTQEFYGFAVRKDCGDLLAKINQGLGQVPGMSYGGYKQSGIGREFSLEGMLESFTQRKNVTVNLTH